MIAVWLQFYRPLHYLRIASSFGRGTDVGSAIAIELKDKFYAPVHDHRGNVCCLLDGTTGLPAQTYRYSAFGESTSFGTPTDNPWKYSSKRLDTHTKLYHFGKRDYDPILGRWLTPDPAGFVDGLNLYAYVNNRPLNYLDPDGCFAESLYEPIVNLWQSPRFQGSCKGYLNSRSEDSISAATAAKMILAKISRNDMT